MPISRKAIRNRHKTLAALVRMHPDAQTELKYSNPWELTVAVVLSARTTDKNVNNVTSKLFKKYKKPADFANARLSALQKDLNGVNFYKNKAKYIKAAAEIVQNEYGGKIPKKLDELIKLPGVGRKTANVILGQAFGLAEGVVVDTHVSRLAQRFGWTKHKDPKMIEKDLIKLFPRSHWIILSDVLIHHGRYVCKARNPQCSGCPFEEPFCPGQSNSKSKK